MKQKLKEFLEKRTEIIFQNKNVKNDFILRNETQDSNQENEKGEIVLRIKTNSISPIQESWGGTWTEEIAEGAFDESLQNKDVFSFIDHKIEMENIIGSTRSGNMKVEKTPDGYEAKIKLDLSEEKSKMLYNKIKKREIVENSFIFIPQETEYRENVDLKEGKVDYHVIHKKGELISIDPVVLAFYPQNNISFNSKIKQIEGELMPFTEEEKSKNISSENIEKKEEMQEDEKDKKIKELEAQIDELKKETQADKDSQPDKEKVNVDAPEHQENIQGEKIDGDEEPKDNETDLEETEKKEEMQEDEKEIDDEEDIAEEVKRSREETTFLIKKGLEEKKFMKRNFKDIQNKILARNIKSLARNESILDNEEIEIFRNKISEYRNEYPSFDKEIEMVAPLALSRSIDGSTTEKGLAYISYINDPEVKTELEKVLPEANGSEYITLETLDIVKKDILIPSTTAAATPLAEGVEATEDENITVSVEFKPTRYAKAIRVNPALSNATQTMEKRTLNDKNTIIQAIRNQFYVNLFQNKTKTFDQVKASYGGGFTKEAIVQTATTGTLKISDIDKMINDLRATYGDSVREKFVMLMHPDTESYIVNEVRKLYTAEWLMDETQRTYRGIQIVTCSAYPDKVDPVAGTGASQVALVMVRKDMITTRGLNFVIEDTPVLDMLKQLVTRLQSTRGEIKMIDPYFNTRALATGAISFRNQDDEPSKKEIKQREKLEAEAKKVIGSREKRAATPEEIDAYVNEKLNQN